MMNEQQKQAIIDSGKEYFRSTIIPNHLKNLNKLQLSSFNINPFLINYLAAYSEPVAFAKALVYPRILGTSLNTSFGQNIQELILSLLMRLTEDVSIANARLVHRQSI